jgi:hypothetical protein
MAAKPFRKNNFIPRETLLSCTDNPREISKGMNFNMENTTYHDAKGFYATNAGYFNSTGADSRAASPDPRMRGSFYDKEGNPVYQ